MQFCKEYNAATQDKAGMIIPVEITVYEDRSFTFVLKTPPASVARPPAALYAQALDPPPAASRTVPPACCVCMHVACSLSAWQPQRARKEVALHLQPHLAVTRAFGSNVAH